jgi:hypothetical protein
MLGMRHTMISSHCFAVPDANFLADLLYTVSTPEKKRGKQEE